MKHMQLNKKNYDALLQRIALLTALAVLRRNDLLLLV